MVAEGIEQRSGRYPLRVEAPVLRAAELLVPGISSVTRYVRYYALYAALGAHAAEHDLDDAASLRLLRRSEVVLAGVSRTHDDPETWPGMAHAVDEVRHSLDTDALRTGRRRASTAPTIRTRRGARGSGPSTSARAPSSARPSTRAVRHVPAGTPALRRSRTCSRRYCGTPTPTCWTVRA